MDPQETYKVELELIRNIASCTRAWTTLDERHVAGDYKLCCWIRTLVGTLDKHSEMDIMELWNCAKMQQLRKSMLGNDFLKYCPRDCPLLINRELQFNHIEFYNYTPEEYASFSPEFRNNRAKVIESVLNKDLVVDTYPLRLKLFPSTICNLRCPFCHIDTTHQADVNENYYRNLYKLMPYLEELEIFGGDPFACSFTKEILFGDELRKYPQIFFSTNTNGQLLNRENAEKLQDLRLGYFIFSVDACSPGIYEKIRVGGKYERLVENLTRFVEMRDQGKINILRIGATFVVSEFNYHEVTQFVEFTESLKIGCGFDLVEGSVELVDKLAEVKASLESGIAKAKEYNNEKVVKNLTSMLKKLPDYSRRMGKLKRIYSMLGITDDKNIRAFFNKHRWLRAIVLRLTGLVNKR